MGLMTGDVYPYGEERRGRDQGVGRRREMKGRGRIEGGAEGSRRGHSLSLVEVMKRTSF